MYIWERSNWPQFSWDREVTEVLLSEVRLEQGKLLGRMEGLGLKLRREAYLMSLTEEVQESSAIEGEQLDREQVRSSVARGLGMDEAGLVPSEERVDGIVQMMLDATENSAADLTTGRLSRWQALLFPEGKSGGTPILTGQFRNDADGSMQVVSGLPGKTRIHFEAPPATALRDEVTQFITWCGEPLRIDPIVKAAIAHLWFLTIHPFSDGNGRIARAITELFLTRAENGAQRSYSLSAQIECEREGYYQILEEVQRGNLNITPWLTWFLKCLNRAILGSQDLLARILFKGAFWREFATESFNLRQQKILNLLLDGAPEKLKSSRYAKLTNCSQDTAYRDILDLIDRGVLEKSSSGGRSTSYALASSLKEKHKA